MDGSIGLPPDGRDISHDAAAITYRFADPTCRDCTRGVCIAPSCVACVRHLRFYAATARHVYGRCDGCGAWRAWEAPYAPRLVEGS